LFGVLFWQLQKLKYNSNTTNDNANTANNRPNPIVLHGIQSTFLAYLIANFFSFDSFSSYLISFLLIGFSIRLISKNVEGDEFSQHRFMPIKRIYADNISKWRGVIIFLLFIGLVWFIWVFNIKPITINKEIRISSSLLKKQDCRGALAQIDEILDSRSILDNYLRLNYVDIINECLARTTETTQILLAEKAISLLEKNAETQPYFTRNWILLGNYTNVLIEKGDVGLKEKADYYFSKAEELSPKRQEIFIGWIKTYFLTRDYQKAADKAQKCIELNPDLGECWWLMALVDIRLKKYEKAEEDINIAAQKGYNTSSEVSLLQLAKIYSGTKDPEELQELIEIYKNLIKINPSNYQYHASLAAVYKEVGDFKNAKVEALKALELFPELKEEVENFLKDFPP